MRTIQRANQNKEALDRKRGCWSRLEEYAKVQDDHFKLLDCPKATGSCGPLTSIPLNGSHQALEKRASNNSDFILRSRQVVLQAGLLDKAKDGNGRILSKSNSLPPIYDSRVTSKHGPKTWVPSRLVERKPQQMGKRANISTVSLRSDRAFTWRQRESAQLDNKVGLICGSLATLIITQHAPDAGVKTLSRLAVDQSSKTLGLEENNLNAKDSGVITEGMKDSGSVCKTKQRSQAPSDSAIETETHSSHRNKTGQEERTTVPDDQEKEYYTRQRIVEWIIGVNASLFSPSKDDLNKVLLKEEDVDTIKIVYGQD